MRIDGAWCWFHSPKAFSKDGVTCVGAVSRTGEQQVHFLNASNKDHVTITLPGSRSIIDDHNVPAVRFLDDSKVFVAYTGHHTDNKLNLDVIDWPRKEILAEQSRQFEFNHNLTYANISLLKDRLRIFTRAVDFNPSYLEGTIGDFSGTTVQKFLSHDTSGLGDRWRGVDGGRPYILYFQDGDDTHFTVCEDHPRAHNNSIYHGVIRENFVYNSLGEQIAPLQDFFKQDAFHVLTKVWETNEISTAWPSDICLDKKGQLTIAFSYQVDESGTPNGVERPGKDLRYAIARWQGDQWQSAEIAFAGSCLYSAESDYAGGISIGRHDSDFLAISSNVMPHNGGSLSTVGRFQIFLVKLKVGSFRNPEFTQITFNNDQDNLRPIFSDPLDEMGHSLLWMQGRYSSFTDFDTQIRKIDFIPEQNCFIRDGFHVDFHWTLGSDTAMPGEEAKFLLGQFSHVDQYLEYGSGSSTLSAISSGVKKVTTVETDGVWAASLRVLAGSLMSDNQDFTLVSANLGPTGAWGTPLDLSLWDGADYASAPWLLENIQPNFVLIDGRFRVRTLFEVVSRSVKPCVILFDDYFDRSHYWVCNDYFDVRLRVGRAAVFFSSRKIADPTPEILAQYSADPR